MIKFSALNESDSSEDEDEEREEGADAGGAIGTGRGAATKEAQEAEVVELFKNAIEVQQRGTEGGDITVYHVANFKVRFLADRSHELGSVGHRFRLVNECLVKSFASTERRATK